MRASSAASIFRHEIPRGVLTRDLAGRHLAAPVVYPGSVERTSFAELTEPKGFVLLEVGPDRARGGRLASSRFVELPTRPMRRLELDPRGLATDTLAERIAALLSGQPATAVVSLRLVAPPEPDAESALRVESLRRLHPPEMGVTVRWPTGAAATAIIRRHTLSPT